MEIHAMRMGPGKHLKGRTLMGGAVKPEEVSFTITRAPIILNNQLSSGL